MVSAAHTTEDLQVTAGALQGELQRLESQKQALERELAAVVAHLGSVRRALGALSHLAVTGPAVAAAGIQAEDDQAAEWQPPVVEDGAAEEPGHPDEDGDGDAVAEQAAASAVGGYGRLTEQILDYLATTGGSEVRAREVAAALGRDENAGSINAVRSTLDRLVGASRVQRAGRGLYRAAV
ncbi:hypothetical protein [Actinacidiphila glaucinigra]|uniref:Uncharacterized protein n=1 Tax=Actinacidiphila glaucinigra TaxID=235986 RepID=A0A239NAH7_9ACTN|nr:hypothetical protein [Actinacidiphila glaucinigra]SNT51218.1 hypothetical protein SAMN05216252_132100 [Actinacidiphila glaucinigra]